MRAWTVASIIAALLSGVLAVVAWRTATQRVGPDPNEVGALRRELIALQAQVDRLEASFVMLRVPTEMPARVEVPQLTAVSPEALQKDLEETRSSLEKLRILVGSMIGTGLVPGDAVVAKDCVAVSEAISVCREDPAAFVAKHRFWFTQDVYRRFGAPDRMMNVQGESPIWIYAGNPGEGGFAVTIGASGVTWATLISPDLVDTWPIQPAER